MEKIKRPTGKCFICHFPTKLPIHAPCINKAAKLPRARTHYKQTARQYAEGNLPYFAKY